MQITVINDDVQEPATNMANDVALWQCVEANPDQAFLRFYDWNMPCVTYGFSQNVDKLKAQFSDLATMPTWIKRPTGGGLVHHVPGGITYSLIVPLSFLPSAQLVASYRWLSEQTVEALRAVGVEATLRQETLDSYQDKRHHEVCIKFPAKYEIVSPTGEKLIGSAQRKGRVSLLQQTQVFGDVPMAFKETLAKHLRV